MFLKSELIIHRLYPLKILLSIIYKCGEIKLFMNPEQCRNHTLNSSYSKHAFKFGRSSRFKAPRLHTHSMYTIEDNKNKKTCGFGFGQRSPIENKNILLSPQTYNIPSTLTMNCKSFGEGRENVKFRSFLQKAYKDSKNPAPGSYYFSSSLHERKFSLGARLPTDVDLKIKKKVPPPNAYNLDRCGSSSSGKFASSKNKNVRKIVFFGREGERKKTTSVGPGQYNIRTQQLSSSERFNKTQNAFGTAERPSPADKSKRYVPGPGMYETFSQFPSQIKL